MKTLSRWSVLLLLAAAPALAVVLPLRIPFQGKLIDPATNNPRNGAFSMQFKLYSAPTGGAALFTETQTVSVTNGVFSVQIGTVALLTPDLFSGASAYLGVTVGADAEMLPRQPLSMSPYAFTAAQLVSDRNIRVNSGTAYSTFTTAGNWEFPYGVTVATGSFMTVVATNTGTFGITTSSGISMGAGTLKLEPDSSGMDATGTGIVASTGVFSSSVTAKQFFGIGVSTIAIKAADQSVSANTVLANDTELAVPIGANQTYSVFGVLFASSTVATNDIKIALAVPAGASMNVGYYANGGSTLTFSSGMLRVSGVQNNAIIQVGASILNPIVLNGTVINGATPGFIQLQWAQFASVATNTTLTTGSYLGATRIK